MCRLALIAALLSALIVGCGSDEPRAAAPTRTPVPQRTAAPTVVNYQAMGQSLLVPLGALIVAARANDGPNSTRFLSEFNAAAEKVLPVIDRDVSVNANRLHSVIVNTREAASRRDVASLEAQRVTLLEVR